MSGGGEIGNKRILSSPESTPPNASKRVNMSTDAKIDELVKAMSLMKDAVEGFTVRMSTMETGIKDSVAELAKRIDIREKVWAEEKAALTNTQMQLESRLDQLERRERRNNILISGLNVNRENAMVVVNGLFAGLEQPVTVDEVSVITAQGGKPKVLARLKNFDDKMKVIKSKKGLSMLDTKGEKVPVFVNDDMTKKDQLIQFRGRALAKEMRAKQKVVKIGFRKLSIDGAWHVWDDATEAFVNAKN